jgi:pimeloyl-ACP methyl ester carboxylesterase
VSDVTHRAGPVRAATGFRSVEHRFEVPLAPGDGRRIGLFAREIRAAAHAGEERPYLLQINGGPGMPNQRPARPGAWLAEALAHFHVLLLDQRGTGLSTPVTAQTLTGTPEEQADYLQHFRADAIVRDAEHVRRALLGDDVRWSIFGQSFGGFTSLTYLSQAPEGAREAFITGGLPPLRAPADDVYRATYRRIEARLAEYLARYPEDEAVWERVVAVEPRYKRLGNELGTTHGLERLHHLAEGALLPSGELTVTFREQARRALDHTALPLYAVLHEPCYAQHEATRWAAERVLAERGDDPLLHGEMVFRRDFEEPSLAPFLPVAELLAEKDDWPALYDPVRLARNEVPVTAAVYLDDVFVDSALSLATADEVAGVRTWVTNELHHDGIHVAPVLDRLIRMRRGEL